MKRFLNFASALFLLAGLSACEFYKLEELNHVQPTGTPFQKALANNYHALARTERKLYDWFTAVHYADKSLRAAYGEEVAPEEPKAWGITGETLGQMEQGRADLLAMLVGDAKEVRPQLAADAQTFFDCWVEQQSEGWQADDIAYCRDEFYDAMRQLMTPAEMPKPQAKAKPVKKLVEKEIASITPPPTVEPMPEPLPQPEAAPEPVPPAPAPSTPEEALMPAADAPKPAAATRTETGSYIVFFDAASAELSSVGQTIIDTAAESLRPHSSYRVIINSSTDTYGGAQDPELPSKRAQAVRDRLMLRGIDDAKIHIVSRGEEVKQEDSVNPVGRRIEIFISE